MLNVRRLVNDYNARGLPSTRRDALLKMLGFQNEHLPFIKRLFSRFGYELRELKHEEDGNRQVFVTTASANLVEEISNYEVAEYLTELIYSKDPLLLKFVRDQTAWGSFCRGTKDLSGIIAAKVFNGYQSINSLVAFFVLSDEDTARKADRPSGGYGILEYRQA